MGPVNNVHEVQQKWHFLCDLTAEKLQWSPLTERSSSAAIHSRRSVTGAATGHELCIEDNRDYQQMFEHEKREFVGENPTYYNFN
ncbi:unnamed protein product [Rotaria sp. Silwood1]|nr:unnamed protein product [Rotaria sp. Silwood1]CAF4684454.1 unnamed protein product [Rotaria sp. Silwood1]CAF4925140.1 unnamed protein product [Rotaria sp. Silwood1]